MCNGTYVDIRNRKAGELLARLALENGAPLSKYDVAELLWPGCGPEQAMGSFYKVHSHIKQLHTALGVKSPLISLRKELRLDMGSVRCDAAEFSHLYKTDAPGNWEKAVELYRGPLLAGDYFEWTAPWEAFFDLRYREILKKLSEYYLQADNILKSAYYRQKLMPDEE